MQHAPLTKAAALLPELAAELARVRELRAFNAASYLDRKVDLIAGYLQQHGLRAAVLGMSGGVDSAVVLGILREVQKRYPALSHLVPLALPTHVAEQGQSAALNRVHNLCKQWSIYCPIGNLHAAHDAIAREIDGMVGTQMEPLPSPWALGQLTSYIRTPALYFATSLLTDRGLPAVVVGTTNRDEGAYLGYVGKASDGMVDLQVIADLHKSEVYQLARQLGVTDEILAAVPSGEMFDGRVDEEVFGAPYDFVELYLHGKCHPERDWQWSQEAFEQYGQLADNLEALHRYNAHKYLVGSPAVHLNVLESAVPEGWTK